jgi:hypothetical protein
VAEIVRCGACPDQLRTVHAPAADRVSRSQLPCAKAPSLPLQDHIRRGSGWLPPRLSAWNANDAAEFESICQSAEGSPTGCFLTRVSLLPLVDLR